MNNNKKFGLPITTSLIVGTMIGSGIFLLPSSLAIYGSMSLAGWCISAGGAITLAWVFAKLSQWTPGLGGPYHYTRVGIGEFPAFLVAWGYWISIWTGNAAIAVAAVSYCKLFFPELDDSKVNSTALALIFVWVFTLINVRGVREAGIVQLLTTLFKAIPLILFGVIGLAYIEPSHFSTQPSVDDSPIMIAISSAALWLWAFLGIESASIPADNIKTPEKTIPKATLIGVLLVAVIYFIGFIVVYGVIEPAELGQSKGPFADAARILWGNWAGIFMTLVALVSTLGALNGLILLGGQMPMAAAQDKLFPNWFGQKNKNQAPGKGIILSTCLTSVLVLLSSSENLLSIFNFALLLSTTSILTPYLFCSASAFRFQINRNGQLKNISLMVIVVAFLFSIWALAGTGQQAVYWGFILMMAGLPVYTFLKISQDKKGNFNEQSK